MTDKELLELAAKAAEIDRTPNGFDKPWNPLTDDGDALRLAVKCCIQIGIDKQNANAMFSLDSIFWENCGDDPYAATRRAIVRAAAEIGKAST